MAVTHLQRKKENQVEVQGACFHQFTLCSCVAVWHSTPYRCISIACWSNIWMTKKKMAWYQNWPYVFIIPGHCMNKLFLEMLFQQNTDSNRTAGRIQLLLKLWHSWGKVKITHSPCLSVTCSSLMPHMPPLYGSLEPSQVVESSVRSGSEFLRRKTPPLPPCSCWSTPAHDGSLEQIPQKTVCSKRGCSNCCSHAAGSVLISVWMQKVERWGRSGDEVRVTKDFLDNEGGSLG